MTRSIKITALFLTLIFILSNCSKDEKHQNKGPVGPVEKEHVTEKGKKKKLPYQSFYELEKLEFFAKSDDMYNTHVTIRAILAYPHEDHDFEKAIIFRRDLINNLIQTYISQKTYSQLNSTDKKEQVKDELLARINRLMGEFPISDIYFRDFFVLPQRKY